MALKTTIDPIKKRFLRGGGEMGDLIRSYDWSQNELGAIENWPQNLLSTLSIILNSKFPMVLFWGKSLIYFYNDAYRPSMGDNGKDPIVLGQKGEACCSEIWSFAKPIFDSIFAGGEANWSEDKLLPIYRNGKLEDAYWTFSFSPVEDERGAVCGVFLTCFETTSKVNTIKKLHASEDELKFAIEAAELATYDFNPKTNKLNVNQRLKDWFGIDAAFEIDLSNAIKAIDEKDIGRLNSAIKNSLQFNSGGRLEIIYTILHPLTKIPRTVLSKGKCWFDENQKAYRLNGTLQDITKEVNDRKKIEKEMSTADLAIQTGELGVYEVDLLTNEFKNNQRFNAIYGVEETMKREGFIAMCHPDDQPIRAKALEDGFRNGSFDYHARFSHGDLAERWLRVKGTVFYDDKKQPIKILGVVQDITEQKNFADSLAIQVKERTMQLKQSNEDLLQFAHVISHDLKEPARKIRTFNSRLKEEYKEKLDSKALSYIEKINNATERMYAMIDGVLFYSTLNNGAIPKRQVNINDLIKQVQLDLEVIIQKNNAVLIIEQLPLIEGASILLYQLFYNLISNSLKFFDPQRSPKIFIAGVVIEYEKIKYARINVSDNGIGFSKEFKEQIFSAFMRLHSKDVYEGTGLGLALCKKIVERHHGIISAESTLEQGAIFTITLPLEQ
ncbi:MAG: ATP-binding protein [Bacteroidia bacterium]